MIELSETKGKLRSYMFICGLQSSKYKTLLPKPSSKEFGNLFELTNNSSK